MNFPFYIFLMGSLFFFDLVMILVYFFMFMVVASQVSIHELKNIQKHFEWKETNKLVKSICLMKLLNCSNFVKDLTIL